MLAFASKAVWIRLQEVDEVQLVSMSHLDVGYTGSMSFTLNSYLSDFFPRAIAVQRALDDANRTEALHYITHSWLVHMFMNCEAWQGNVGKHLDAPLQCPDATFKAAFANAVKRGTITWHAGAATSTSFWTISEGCLGSSPPHTRRALCSTWLPCLVDADWGLRSDLMTDSCLQAP